MSDKPNTPENADSPGTPETAKKDVWTDNAETSVMTGVTEDVPNRDRRSSETTPNKDVEWQRSLINRLSFAALNEQRRARRWSVFFKGLGFVYLFMVIYMFFPKQSTDLHLGRHTALVDISGEISDSSAANADTIIGGMRDAFEDKGTKAIILRINSPGGSPVQAGYVYDEIVRLRLKYPTIPVYTVVADLCASAAYYIASASDKIYADKASLVGSIGVLMDGYGFVETMKKLGVERRLMTAGEHKGFLDPFSPVKEADQQFMQELINNVHLQFITAVKKGRGDRLKDDPLLFSGMIWSGDKAVENGLVDGLGSASYVAREIVGEEHIVDFTPRPDFLASFADRIGIAGAKSLAGEFMVPGMK